LTGKTRSLSEFRGRRLLLIYWSPDCGFCDMSAPELVQMQSALEENHTQLVLVSYGNAEANQKLAAEHGLNCTILLLKDPAAEKYLSEDMFKYCGTPSAYLLDEQGHVAQRLAVGMTEVVTLAREAANGAQPKKATEHRIAFPFVLQERWKLSRQYGIFATPVAFLIGKDGVIMRDVAKGRDQIMTLAREGLASR